MLACFVSKVSTLLKFCDIVRDTTKHMTYVHVIYICYCDVRFNARFHYLSRSAEETQAPKSIHFSCEGGNVRAEKGTECLFSLSGSQNEV